MKQVICSVPGKIILTGEHSVVYGHPALLAAIGMRARIRIRKIKKPVIRLSSDKLRGEREVAVSEVKKYWKQAKKSWQLMQNGRGEILENLRRDKYVVMLCAAGKSLEDAGEIRGGLEVKLETQLPIISGFGSSAYTAAAVIGAVGELLELEWDLKKINELSYEVEKIMHGTPSGGDPTIVVYGGLIKFQKLNKQFIFNTIDIKKIKLPKIFILNSGRASESTGKMVAMVRQRVKENKKKYGKLLNRIGAISDEFINALEKDRFNKFLLKENERLLEELGVVGKKAQSMIQLIEEIGGVVKISGGGGWERGSGVLIACHDEPERLENLIVANNWESFITTIGDEGWRKEQYHPHQEN